MLSISVFIRFSFIVPAVPLCLCTVSHFSDNHGFIKISISGKASFSSLIFTFWLFFPFSYFFRFYCLEIMPTLQFSSVSQLCLTLCDPMDCSTPGLPVHCQLPEFTQTHVHWVGYAIQPSHPLSSHSPLAFNLSPNQGLFKSVSSSYQVAKGLEFQLQHQSFQWIFRADFL